MDLESHFSIRTLGKAKVKREAYLSTTIKFYSLVRADTLLIRYDNQAFNI